MEQYHIKTVTFGGFDKQDVVQYIERVSQEAANIQKELQEENEGLRQRLDEMAAEISALRKENNRLTSLQKELEAQRVALSVKLSQKTDDMRELESLRSEVSRLSAEAAALRPDAKAYVQFRERLGYIECEARERAADLEEASAAQIQKTIALFRTQYQGLMNTFETAASHVTDELRKVEVRLIQLPRAMDQAGTEMDALTALLSEKTMEKEDKARQRREE